MINRMDDGEHTFEVTGVGDNNSSSLFKKVERCGHDGLRERDNGLFGRCLLLVIYALSHGEIIRSARSERECFIPL